MDHFAKFMDKVLTVDLLIDFYCFEDNELILTKVADDGAVHTVKLMRDIEYYTIYDSESLEPIRIPEAVKLPTFVEPDIVPIAFKPPVFGGTLLYILK